MALQKKKDYDATDILASIATAAGALDTAGDAVRLASMPRAIAFTLNVTAAGTDAGDLLDVKVQTKIDGTNWIDIVYFPQILGNGGAKSFVEKVSADIAVAGFPATTALTAGDTRDIIGDDWRVAYVQVDADSNGSFTFSVTACPM